MIKEFLGSRELILRLIIRDFSSKYRQSVFGIMWAFIMPLLTVGLFVGMSKAGILNIKDVDMPYPLYAIIGLTIWNIFTVGMSSASLALVSAGNMVTKVNFPKSALVFSSTCQSLVEFGIRAVLIAALFIYYGIAPSWSGLFLGIGATLPLIFTLLGLAFIISLVGVVIRDMANIIGLVLTVIMLLTPVLYPISGGGVLATVNIYNPVNYLVNVPRDLIVKGYTDMGAGYLIVSIISFFVFFLGWRLFYHAEPKIAERL